MPTYAPSYVVVPCANGLGAATDAFNQSILTRRRIPQPFLSLLDDITLASTVLPTGYVGLVYSTTQEFGATVTVSLASGALPTGLSLTQPTATSLEVSGTPTIAGVYNFTANIVRGTNSTNEAMQITISASPDSGSGGVGGG